MVCYNACLLVTAILQVFDVQAARAPVISCFTSTNTSQGLPAVQPLQYNSTVTTWRTAAMNGTAYATNSTSNYYSNATYNSTSNSSMNSTWSSREVYSEPFVCAAYHLGICSPGEDCQGYDAVPGVGSWAYYPLTLSQCYQMQWMSQQPDSLMQGVKCCTMNNCNAPDPALDSTTSIIGAASGSNASEPCQGVLVEARDPGTGIATNVCVSKGVHLRVSNCST
jgi:hypothetical protein